MSAYYKNPLLILTVCGLLLFPLTELTGLTTTTASENPDLCNRRLGL